MGAAESAPVRLQNVPTEPEAECALHALVTTPVRAGANVQYARLTADDAGLGFNRWRFMVTYRPVGSRGFAVADQTPYTSEAVYEDRARALYAGYQQFMAANDDNGLGYFLHQRKEDGNGYVVWLDFATAKWTGPVTSGAAPCLSGLHAAAVAAARPCCYNTWQVLTHPVFAARHGQLQHWAREFVELVQRYDAAGLLQVLNDTSPMTRITVFVPATQGLVAFFAAEQQQTPDDVARMLRRHVIGGYAIDVRSITAGAAAESRRYPVFANAANQETLAIAVPQDTLRANSGGGWPTTVLLNGMRLHVRGVVETVHGFVYSIDHVIHAQQQQPPPTTVKEYEARPAYNPVPATKTYSPGPADAPSPGPYDAPPTLANAHAYIAAAVRAQVNMRHRIGDA